MISGKARYFIKSVGKLVVDGDLTVMPTMEKKMRLVGVDMLLDRLLVSGCLLKFGSLNLRLRRQCFTADVVATALAPGVSVGDGEDDVFSENICSREPCPVRFDSSSLGRELTDQMESLRVAIVALCNLTVKLADWTEVLEYFRRNSLQRHKVQYCLQTPTRY